jgi:hypothetical protein
MHGWTEGARRAPASSKDPSLGIPRRKRALDHRAVFAAVIVVAGATWLAPAAQAAAKPTITATWVTDVTATSANLRAEVNPEGLETDYRFEYLTEAAYSANIAAGREAFAGGSRAPGSGEAFLGEEEEPVPVVQRLERLSPATAYRYRVLARNEAGEKSGPPRLLTTQSSGGVTEECANSRLRIEDASTGLPDCRAWEMVSPPEKDGGAVQGFGGNFGGDVLQAAAAGGQVTYSSSASFGAEAQGAPPASQYISRRGASGWTTQNITAPTVSGAYGAEPEGVPFQLFSPNLASALLLDGRRCGEGAQQCPRSYSLRDEGGALVPTLEAPGLRFVGADEDLAHPVFSTCAALSAQATEVPGGGGGCDPADPNLYESSGGPPQLVNVLPGDTHGTPGAALAAQSGAVSADGTRVYWVGPGADLYLHDGGSSKAVDVSGEALFQTASSDGSLAYFLKAGHLYRWSAATEASTDLTPAGGVVGVLGASEDGSRVYYATGSGLFLRDEGTVTEVAAGPAAAAPGDYPPTTGTARVSADGGVLAFLSTEALGEVDNTDQATGLPDPEAYIYEAATNRLTCASCNPTGERPLGPSSIPGASANGAGPEATDLYKPRVLAAGGRRLFFDSTDRLVPRDSSAAQDVYEWEAGGEGSCLQPAGCVFLISSGRSSQPSEFIDASADGSDVFFLTADSLAAADPGSVDLYDAREAGGYPVPTPPIPCEGDACQPIPSPPEDPSPGTLVGSTPNPKPSFPKTHHKKPKKHRHKGKSKGSHHQKKSPGKHRRQRARSERGRSR